MITALRILVHLRKLVFHPLLYYALAWLLALASAGALLYTAWVSFDSPKRNDGNEGHCTIDFGGQYAMGRMLVTGHGRDLYNRGSLRAVLQQAYPTVDQEPDAKTSDADNLLGWFMGEDDANVPRAFAVATTAVVSVDPFVLAAFEAARQEEWSDERMTRVGGKRQVGGPLYPPINAFVYAPLALLPPREAYRINQVLNVLLLFAAGLGVSVATRGGVWWPMAAFVLIVFPGTAGSVNLGQNSSHTIAIAAWGWALAARGRPGWGGVVWGLLAFKPVWALAFLLVPLLTGRWRMALTMMLTGTGIALATLPFVGMHSWLEWLQVGKWAADLYKTDINWVFLSRDLLGVPRRWLLNFADGMPREPIWFPPPSERGGEVWHWLFGSGDIPAWLFPSLAGWLLVAFVLEMTVRAALLRRTQARTASVGPTAAFVLLGAWLLCYHFMYYDVLLAALPLLLLWHHPSDFLRPIYLVMWVEAGAVAGYDFDGFHGPRLLNDAPPRPPLLPIGYRNVWVFNRMVPNLTLIIILSQVICPLLGLGGYHGPPWDTFVLMALWMWCFILWMMTPPPITV